MAYYSEGYKKALRDERNRKRKGMSRGMKKFLKVCLYIAAVLAVLCASIFFAYANEIRSLAQSVSKIEKTEEEDVGNILLIGTDARDSDSSARSDMMLLISIVPTLDRISITSFMRDTCVSTENYGAVKLTDLYALAGPEAVCQSLEELYGISISDYACVDLYNAWRVIDLLGGSRVDLTLAEAQNMNGLIFEINQECGEPYGSSYMAETEQGVTLLDGKQALAYSRIRYLDTDAVRTNRQKKVILGVLKNWAYMAGHLQLGKLAAVYSGIPKAGEYVRTTLTEEKIRKFLSIGNILACSTYSIQTQTIPISGTWSDAWLETGAEVVQIDDLDYNRNWLHRNVL